jgi:polysaccharide export outer membrane protein
MHKSPAKLILLSFRFQGLTLVPALAQAVVPADGRVGVQMNAPIPSTAADAAAGAPSAAPPNVTSYVLGPEDQITVRVFAANDLPNKPVQIDNDGTVTLPMIGQVHAAGLTVEQLQ